MRPVTVNVGPVTAQNTTNIASGQPTAAGQLALNIAGLDTWSWRGTASIAGNVMTVTGTTTGAIAYGDALSGLNVAPGTKILGPGPGAVANTYLVSVAQTLASQTIFSNAKASLGVAQRLAITASAGGDVGKILTLVGTDYTGAVQTEQISILASTQSSQLDYLTLTSASISAAAAAPIQIGTFGTASSPWVRLDEYAQGPTSITCQAVGTVNYTVQQTNQDPNSLSNPVLPSQVTWVNSSDVAAVAATASIQTVFANPPLFVRVTLNSGTGNVVATISQVGVAPY